MFNRLNDPLTSGLLHRLPEPPRQVAVLRASRIGDFICAGPAFRALRAVLPEAQITIITLPLLQDLAARLPYFDRFEPFPGFPGIAEQLFDASRTLRFFEKMQRQRFDLALQMQGSGVYSNPFTLMLGAKATAGFIREGDPAGRLDAALPLPRVGHEVLRVLALPEFLGAFERGRETEFPLTLEDHAMAEARLAQAERPLIGLHPAARDMTRHWPLDHFITAGIELRRHYGGTLVLLGEPEERLNAEEIGQRLGPPVLNLVGATPLAVLGAVLARLTLLVTNDSGPAHIAYALWTPTVTIFGGGDPLRYGPPPGGPFRALVHEVACRPCHDGVCPINYECLRGISAAEVVAAAEQVLADADQHMAQPHRLSA
jgi:ADP-heptose:LPS heptosyltransferase